MSRKKKPGSSTSLAVIFLLLIISTALFSFVAKGFFIIKEGRFGQGNTYSVFASNKKQSELIVFHKDKNSISIIKADVSTDEIYKYLQVPITAFFENDNLNLEKSTPDKVSDLVWGIATSENNINLSDGIKMLFMARTVSPRDIKEELLSQDLAESQRDEVMIQIFSDPRITEEHKGIEIVNNTLDSGVGNRYARLASNIVGDIVLVTTGQEKEKSAIYSDEESYTAKRLSQILNFPIVKGNISRLGDVTVSVGKDYGKISKH